MAIDVAPDYVEPLEAWRVWRVVAADGAFLLGSVTKPTLWPVGETFAAECLHVRIWLPWRKSHTAPQERCECGIYATTLERAIVYASARLPRDTVGWAIGRVALWGTVVQCERGYRASCAYPIEIYLPCDPAKVDAHLVAAELAPYRVPVIAVSADAHDCGRLIRAMRLPAA